MGATLSSPSRADSAELDELRRRAYGPEADIGTDAAAQARLVELESALHRPAAPAPIAGTGPIGVPERPFEEPAASPAGPARSWCRGRGAAIAAIAVILVAGSAVAATLSAGPLDTTLYPRAEIPQVASAQLNGSSELGYLGIARADVRLYDEFRGLNIWSGPRGTSTTCLFVTTDSRPRWRVDCTPWSGEPTIDLVKYREGSRLAGVEAWGDMPVGSMIRLVLRHGAVAVQVVDAPLRAETAR